MTKEKLFKEFLLDPLIVEKKYLTEDQVARMRFIDPTEIKLIETIKIAINGNVDNESPGVTSRKINTFLNRQ